MNENSPTTLPAGEAELDLACETLYRFFAAALSDPRQNSLAILTDPLSRELACQAADLVREQFQDRAVPLGFGEAPIEELDLTALRHRDGGPDELESEFTRVFGLGICRECPPYETEYHPADDPFFRAQQMADVAGFYRAFGLDPSPAAHERPDFVGLELEFAAFLLLRNRMTLAGSQDDGTSGQAAICHAARFAFFRDHLCWWLPSFALALRQKAGHGFFEQIGRALAALLPVERTRFGIPAPRVPKQAQSLDTPHSCDGCLAACS